MEGDSLLRTKKSCLLKRVIWPDPAGPPQSGTPDCNLTTHPLTKNMRNQKVGIQEQEDQSKQKPPSNSPSYIPTAYARVPDLTLPHPLSSFSLHNQIRHHQTKKARKPTTPSTRHMQREKRYLQLLSPPSTADSNHATYNRPPRPSIPKRAYALAHAAQKQSAALGFSPTCTSEPKSQKSDET